MVRAGTSHNVKTPLHIFERSYIASHVYCEKFIQYHVRLFRGAVSQDFLFMDDNVRPHRITEVLDALESENAEGMACLLFRLKSHRAYLRCSWQKCFSKTSPSPKCGRTENRFENGVGQYSLKTFH